MEIFSKAFIATLEEEWYSLTGSCSSPLALLLGLPSVHVCCKQQAQEFVSCVLKVDLLFSGVKVSGIKS